MQVHVVYVKRKVFTCVNYAKVTLRLSGLHCMILCSSTNVFALLVMEIGKLNFIFIYFWICVSIVSLAFHSLWSIELKKVKMVTVVETWCWNGIVIFFVGFNDVSIVWGVDSFQQAKGTEYCFLFTIPSPCMMWVTELEFDFCFVKWVLVFIRYQHPFCIKVVMMYMYPDKELG